MYKTHSTKLNQNLIEPQPLPVKQSEPIDVTRTNRQIGRTNRSAIGKGIVVNIGDNIQSALDSVALDGGGVVHLTGGRFLVDYNIVVPQSVTLEGEGIDITEIDFNDEELGISAGGPNYVQPTSGFRMRNFTVSSSGAVASIAVTYANHFSIDNVRVNGNGTGAGVRILDCVDFNLDTVSVNNCVTSGFHIEGDTDFITQRFKLLNCRAYSNYRGFYLLSGTNHMFYGSLMNCRAYSNSHEGFYFWGTGGSALDTNVSSCFASANGTDGFSVDVNCQRILFVNCVSDVNTQKGFNIAGYDNQVVNCYSGGIMVVSSGVYVGNDVAVGATLDPKARLVIPEYFTQSGWNKSDNTRTVRRIYFMKNTSGGQLVEGDTVILKSVASGDEVTTTTTAGDVHVFGMIAETVADGTWGQVLIEGYTTKLKVNGTADIAIGDYLTSFTTAGIAAKATAGQICHAMALEAYTANDSSGVIDALIIKPRQI